MNPEIEFRNKFKADYTGMTLTELPFAEIANHSGQIQTYKLDLITPLTLPQKPMPVVFFIHGGGFLQPCDKRQAYICMFARKLTEVGYAVVSPDYPVFDDEQQMAACGGEAAGYAIAGEAVHLAYRYLYNHDTKLNLDMDKVAIIGGSAGGMTAFYAIANWSDCYRAFINLWGAPDPVPDLAKFPPTLSVHGNADPLVAYERELPIQAELEQHHIPHELITLDGSGHTPLNRMGEFLPQAMELLDNCLDKAEHSGSGCDL